MKDVELVVEAVPERWTSSGTSSPGWTRSARRHILATNTSSLSVTEIGVATAAPAR